MQKQKLINVDSYKCEKLRLKINFLQINVKSINSALPAPISFNYNHFSIIYLQSSFIDIFEEFEE